MAKRYRIVEFLKAHGVECDAKRMAAMIDEVEDTRRGRMREGGVLLEGKEKTDCAYVTLADRLDGIFLDSSRGVEAVVEKLAGFDRLRTTALRKGWRAARIASPHTPFLLDMLQLSFSKACSDRHGFPPLIEVHHDGELLLVAPEEGFTAIYETALDELAQTFDLRLRVDVNARGARNILDGGRSLNDLLDHLKYNPDTASRAVMISVDLVHPPSADPNLKQPMEEAFGAYGVGPRWPDFARFGGRLLSPWSAKDADEARAGFIVEAAALAVALACDEPEDKALRAKVPGAEARESELKAALEAAGVALPDWIAGCAHKLSRQSLIAALAAAAAQNDHELRARLLEPGGLADLWLKGDGAERRGLLEKIDNPGARMARAACGWMRARLSGAFLPAEDEEAEGRCHFTNEPVARSAAIDGSTGVYGVKVSAFSGREGRVEFIDRSEAQTLLSPLALAEHRLRELSVTRRKGEPQVPVLLSSPVSSGLFASLRYSRDVRPEDFSLYDIARLSRKNADDLVFKETTEISQRYRIGRYQSLPNHLAKSGTAPGLISFIKIAFETALRTGRHLT